MLSISKSAFGAAIAAILAVAIVSAATVRAGAAARTCPSLDGKFEIAKAGDGTWKDGVQAPGIDIQSASDQRVVFSVAKGITLTQLCVKTGSELNNYSIDKSLPVDGPATVTVTKVGAGLGSISFDTEVTKVTCSDVQAPQLSFDDPLYIDRQRAGGEPVSVVAQDGSINVSAHAGTTHVYKNPDAAPGARDFALGYFNQTLNWRSTDGGRTWDYVGTAGQREGPHSATSTGFSDPDFAMDQAGNLYNVEIDLANISVFRSPDDGQSYPTANPFSSAGDRPWLTALQANEVFLYVNLPKGLFRSTDGGVTWLPLPTPPVTSKSNPDPRNPDNGLIGPVGIGRFAISGDDAKTWKTYNFGPHGNATQFFGVLGVDRAGNVYQATAGGYHGSSDVTPDGEVSFMYYDRDTGATNQQKIVIPTPAGDALWPWIVAGDDGRVAVVWYQSLAGAPDDFYIFAAYTTNAHGTTVPCSDGSTKFVPPKFTVVNASKRPVHVGKVCLEGTTCNADTDFEGGDRRLGDFFTVNYDLDGNMFINAADTRLENPLGGPKPVANPIFIRQNGGDPMLEQPIPARPSRCLWPIPSC